VPGITTAFREVIKNGKGFVSMVNLFSQPLHVAIQLNRPFSLNPFFCYIFLLNWCDGMIMVPGNLNFFDTGGGYV